MDNKGKSIFITGGSRGIGLAIARHFARNNFKVAICSRSLEHLSAAKQQIADDCGVDVLTLQCDVTDRAQIRTTASAVLNAFGSIDILVNNAGVFIPGNISEEDEDVFETTMKTNLNSTYYMLKEFLPQFMKRGSGSIFNICSTASKMAYPNGGSYVISKFAQLGLTKALRQEMVEYGVRVTAVMPGATLTDSWAGTELSEERFMMASDIALAVFNCQQLPERAVVEEIQLRPQLGDI
jgi:NAD(P)-dependent dehydrogenase (short-subunit alcohol dehydrogenase family)